MEGIMKRRDLLKGLLLSPLAFLGWKPVKAAGPVAIPQAWTDLAVKLQSNRYFYDPELLKEAPPPPRYNNGPRPYLRRIPPNADRSNVVPREQR